MVNSNILTTEVFARNLLVQCGCQDVFTVGGEFHKRYRWVVIIYNKHKRQEFAKVYLANLLIGMIIKG